MQGGSTARRSEKIIVSIINGSAGRAFDCIRCPSIHQSQRVNANLSSTYASYFVRYEKAKGYILLFYFLAMQISHSNLQRLTNENEHQQSDSRLSKEEDLGENIQYFLLIIVIVHSTLPMLVTSFRILLFRSYSNLLCFFDASVEEDHSRS